jgi:hypothetical protein
MAAGHPAHQSPPRRYVIVAAHSVSFNHPQLEPSHMYKYSALIRLSNGSTAWTFVWASNDLEAKLLAETQYGAGSVISWTRASD